jgi:hypothetical protein
MFIIAHEGPAGHLPAKLREIDIPVKREWLTDAFVLQAIE